MNDQAKIWALTIFPLLFLADILYGLLLHYGYSLPVTPGVLMRGSLLAISFVYVVLYYNKLPLSLRIWLFLILSSVLPSILVRLESGGGISYDLLILSKTIYFPILTMFMVLLVSQGKLSHLTIVKYIEYSAYVLGLSLLISQVLGISRPTYGTYAYGSTGIFYSQNDMTLAFGLALLAAAYRVIVVKFSLIRLLMVVLSAYACLQIGTRASLGVVLATGLTTVALVLWNRSVSRSYIVKISKATSGFALLAGLSVMVLSSLGQQMEFGYQQKKLEQIQKGEFPRQLIVDAGMRQITNRPAIANYTGEGADSFFKGTSSYYHTSDDDGRKSVEVDWVDLLGAFGIFYTVIIYLFALIPCIYGAWRFLGYREADLGLMSAASFLYLAYSTTVGHAFVTPIPSTLMAGYLVLFYSRKYRSPENKFDGIQCARYNAHYPT